MTYGEAYDCMLTELYNPDKYHITEETKNLVHDLVDDACYKADKYRWHDLRKNPNDLPQLCRKVIVCTEVDDYAVAYYDTAFCSKPKVCTWRFFNPSSYCCKDYLDVDEEVIAWREIEWFGRGE